MATGNNGKKELIDNALFQRLIFNLKVAWGLIMLGMGFVKSYAGLINARFFLGVAEAGLKPGAVRHY